MEIKKMATVEAAARKQKIRSQTQPKDTVNQTNPTDLFYFISVCIDTGHARCGSFGHDSVIIGSTVGDYVIFPSSARESERMMKEYYRRPASILKYIESL